MLALPTFCCDGPDCQSKEPDFLKREPFIKTDTASLKESDREWIAYRIAKLQKWRKETAAAIWAEEEVEEHMPDPLLMSDRCLEAVAKNGDSLANEDTIRNFLKPWAGVEKHSIALLDCLKMSTMQGDAALIPSKQRGKKL